MHHCTNVEWHSHWMIGTITKQFLNIVQFIVQRGTDCPHEWWFPTFVIELRDRNVYSVTLIQSNKPKKKDPAPSYPARFRTCEGIDWYFSHSVIMTPCWVQYRDQPISHCNLDCFEWSWEQSRETKHRARKCIWHCFSCDMGYLSTRVAIQASPKGSVWIRRHSSEINPYRTRNNAICISYVQHRSW